jgi:nicotinate phosphoribosyltransferase
MRARRDQDIAMLDPGVCRLMNPHIYHVSLSAKLWDLKQSLIKKALPQES